MNDQPSANDVLNGNLGEMDQNIQDLFGDDLIPDQVKEQNEKLAQENKEIARAYARVFSSEQGKKVLEDLLDRTLRESVYMPERDNAEMLGHVREGQNSIVRHISQCIQKGKAIHQQDKAEDE